MQHVLLAVVFRSLYQDQIQNNDLNKSLLSSSPTSNDKIGVFPGAPFSTMVSYTLGQASLISNWPY